MTLAEGVERFVERQVDATSMDVRDKKIIHDAIWGTQLLYQHEVALVDSPLLQRLRYIHQTGFAFLTYPSARHTRFDHSLGVLHQTARLIRHLREEMGPSGGSPNPLDDSAIWKLRLTALLHDCSHGPFSHTSEEVYSLFDDVQEYIGPGQEFEGGSASEMLAVLILQSEAFRDYFRKLAFTYNLTVEVDDIAKLIRGADKVSASGFLTDLINGPFDADKLDYIFRDSQFVGLPLSVDIDRLGHSVEIQKLEKGAIRGATQEMRRLVINASGVNALEQIVFARMGLTTSAYHHHKVRACDSMFKRVVEYCRKHAVPLCGRDLTSAADFLHMTDYDFFAESERNPDTVVQEMVDDIYKRRLFKRALVISMNSIENIEAGDRDSEKAMVNTIQNLVMLKKTPEGREDLLRLAAEIWSEAGKPGRVEDIWVDFPDEPKLKDLMVTIVNTGTKTKPEFVVLQDFIPLDQWGKQYLLNKWRGHVFCRPQDVTEVSEAASSVIGARYGVSFNSYATKLAHLNT